ncbi:MAG: SufE family protein [Oscillospiraceae bacterium]
MSSIKEIQDGIVRDFLEIGDAFDQYAYLIELSCLQPPLPEELKTEERAVKGCQSSVWLDMRAEDGHLVLHSDSNTLIIKGVLYILEEILSGQPLGQVAEAEIDFLQRTAIMDTFESSRRKGLGYVIAAVRRFAADSLAGA